MSGLEALREEGASRLDVRFKSGLVGGRNLPEEYHGWPLTIVREMRQQGGDASPICFEGLVEVSNGGPECLLERILPAIRFRQLLVVLGERGDTCVLRKPIGGQEAQAIVEALGAVDRLEASEWGIVSGDQDARRLPATPVVQPLACGEALFDDRTVQGLTVDGGALGQPDRAPTRINCEIVLQDVKVLVSENEPSVLAGDDLEDDLAVVVPAEIGLRMSADADVLGRHGFEIGTKVGREVQRPAAELRLEEILRRLQRGTQLLLYLRRDVANEHEDGLVNIVREVREERDCRGALSLERLVEVRDRDFECGFECVLPARAGREQAEVLDERFLAGPPGKRLAGKEAERGGLPPTGSISPVIRLHAAQR